MPTIDSDLLNNNSQGPEDLAPVRKRPDIIVSDERNEVNAETEEEGWRSDDVTVATSMLTLANASTSNDGAQMDVLYDYYDKDDKEVDDEITWANSASSAPVIKAEPPEMAHSGAHLELFISKEPEDLTRRSPVVQSTDRIHSSVISRALANGELVNAGFDALHSLDEPNSPVHARRLTDESIFSDAEIKAEITYQNDNSYTTTTLTTVPYENSSYSVIANTGSQRYNSRQYSGSSPSGGEYYPEFNNFANGENYTQNRRIVYSTSEQAADQVFIERYNVNGRQAVYKVGNNVDLPSPDSGIGESGTPREAQTVQHANFDYTDPFNANGLLADALRDSAPSVASDDDRTQPSTPLTPLTPGGSVHSVNRSKSWECARNEPDKFQIPKVYSNYGFRYYLESPISTSQRREDDRITYINKGQFYGITLEYIPDPDRPLKSTTVKSVIMLVFREEKSSEDELKAWAFWHGRQHSIKQRILDAGRETNTKNSAGLVGHIEEVSHNAIAVYWNPLESAGKVNIAVQCLSTDFSSQKGVKGLPLHVQIDTYDEHKEGPPCHRGYCQIKIFCDKGAERKTRDEERRAAKRKMAQSVRSKRIDELYHSPCERSEFYSMADLLRQPVLFTPSEDEKVGGPLDLQGFYIEHHDLRLRGLPRQVTPAPVIEASPDPELGRRQIELPSDPDLVSSPHLYSGGAVVKRRRLRPPEYEAILIHVRQDGEDIFTSLYVAPPTVQGLVGAIVEKYKMSAETIRGLYRKNRINGAVSRLDDNVLKHYCNEELFHMDITRTDSDGLYDVTFVELDLS
ncbi:protein grainyhead-like isoform X3 [Artemia franciscana]|uniref:protein grainyhead-like isoform X3 n=2 Tax=Artemia franciscana TaxID=6661 RepID=UPI0032DA9A65